MTTTEEIKPCPACGGSHIECGGVVWDGVEDVKEKHYMVCLSCMMTGPEKSTKEKAAAAWSAMPRREEFYAELMGLLDLQASLDGLVQMLDGINKLAERYAPKQEDQ